MNQGEAIFPKPESSAYSGALDRTPCDPRVYSTRGRNPASEEDALENGGRGWDRTSDPYDVNVVLYQALTRKPSHLLVNSTHTTA